MSNANQGDKKITSRMWQFLRQLIHQLHQFYQSIKRNLRKIKRQFLRNFTRWIDPKLEPYRIHRETPPTSATPNQSINNRLIPPATTEEFFDLLKRTPRSVLGTHERHVLSAIMQFPDRKISSLMLPKTAITYVDETEVIGPLTLDRLYRSGMAHFPVINRNEQVIGLLHTANLNSLEVRDSLTARDLLDPTVYYIREDYNLSQALAAFLRTSCYFLIVIDQFGQIVGMLPCQNLIEFLLGDLPDEDFMRDDDRLAVAKRKLPKPML